LSDAGGAKQALPVLHGLPPRSGQKQGGVLLADSSCQQAAPVDKQPLRGKPLKLPFGKKRAGEFPSPAFLFWKIDELLPVYMACTF
jgi:hypothetical protein